MLIADSPRLDWTYKAALAFHALVLVTLAALSASMMTGPRGADSAPDSPGFGVLIWLLHALPVLLAGVISVVVWLSRWLSYRLGQVPSPGHKALAIAGALPYLALVAYVVMVSQ